MNEVNELLLEHFGTKGMKWGVRKSPEEKQSNRNIRAKKFEDKAKKIQAKIDKAEANPRSVYSYQVSELRVKKQTALEDAQRKREGKLSKRQKQVVIGASVAGVLLTTYATYSSIQSGNARRLTDKGKDFVLKKKGLPWKLDPELRDPNLNTSQIHDKIVKHINPKYGQPGTKMNCRRATYAYEMRRRGYNVQATRTTNARGQDPSGVYNVLHPNTNLVPAGRLGILTRILGETRKTEKPFTEFVSDPSTHIGSKLNPLQIFDGLSDQPQGARGELGMVWASGGGHSMSWENIKGQITIFDNQSGKKYSTPDELDVVAKNMASAGFTRLDNLPLNDDFLRRWIKNA